MRKLTIASLVLMVSAAAALLSLRAFVSTDTLRDAMIAAVKDNTGRTLSIDGEISHALVPRIRIIANRVTVLNPPGFGTEFATIERMEINLGLISALTGTPEIEGIVLVNPTINLAVDETGRNNWTFAAPGTANSAGGNWPDLNAEEFAAVTIANGQVIYTDTQTGIKQTISGVNLKVSPLGASGALTADATMLLNGEQVTLATSLTTPARLNTGDPAKLTATITAKGFTADLTGDLQKQENRRFELANARLATPGTTVTGKVSLAPGANRPFMTADLTLDKLNLTGIPDKETAGAGKGTGWSKQEIDFDGLTALDGDFKLAAGEFHYGKFKTGAIRIEAKLRNGVLTADMPGLEFYDGSAKGTLTIDGSTITPVLLSKGEFKGVNALPFLRDAADVNKIEGRTDLTFNLRSSGASVPAIMAALDGSANLRFEDGALLGVDIARILHAVKQGRRGGFAKGGKTPFGKIIAEFRFKNGVGTNNRLRMSGGEVVITGGGKVTMPNRTLAYRINPYLVGRGGITVLGINVPIIITGPWANPSIYPDLPGILDAPDIALKGLKTVGGTGVGSATGVIEKVSPIGPGSVTKPLGDLIKKPLKKGFRRRLLP